MKLREGVIAMVRMLCFLWSAGVILSALVASSGFSAPNPFSRFVKVNDAVITHYEHRQRVLMLETFGVKGDVAVRAERELIEERLKLSEAALYGLSVDARALRVGMAQYVQRFNLSVEEVLTILARRGVARETFEDFVRAGLLWNQVIRIRFNASFEIADEEIERASAFTSKQNAARIDVLEIMLLARNADEQAAAVRFFDTILPSIAGREDFEAMARLHSVAPSRESGGAVGWVTLSELPPGISSRLIALNIGEISKPIKVDDRLVVYFANDFEEPRPRAQKGAVLDYVRGDILLAEGEGRERREQSAQKESAKALVETIRNSVDQCSDLTAYALANPALELRFDLKKHAEIDPSAAKILDELDENEISAPREVVNEAGGQVERFFMLCKRTANIDNRQREAIRRALLERRIENFSAIYLDVLRANAVISHDE